MLSPQTQSSEVCDETPSPETLGELGGKKQSALLSNVNTAFILAQQ